MVPVLSDGALIAPAVFFALILNSYFPPSTRSVTVKAQSGTLTWLAFIQDLEGRSRFSTMYPVNLWPPSYLGSVQMRVTEFLVTLITSGLPGGSKTWGEESQIPMLFFFFMQKMHLGFPSYNDLPMGSRATTGSDGRLGLPTPAKLIAITRNSYSRPSVNPVTLNSFILIGVLLALFHKRLFLSLNSIWYPTRDPVMCQFR